MATDAFPGSPLARGQDIHGTLRKSQRLCVHWWAEPGKPGPYKQDLGLPLGRQLNIPFKHRHEGAGWTLAESSPKFSYTCQSQAGKAAHHPSREGRQTALSVIYWDTAQPCSTHLICTSSNHSALHKSSENPPPATGPTLQMVHMKTKSTLGPWADIPCWRLEKKAGAS